jgi:hypothetical protein
MEYLKKPVEISFEILPNISSSTFVTIGFYVQHYSSFRYLMMFESVQTEVQAVVDVTLDKISNKAILDMIVKNDMRIEIDITEFVYNDLQRNRQQIKLPLLGSLLRYVDTNRPFLKQQFPEYFV